MKNLTFQQISEISASCLVLFCWYILIDHVSNGGITGNDMMGHIMGQTRNKSIQGDGLFLHPSRGKDIGRPQLPRLYIFLKQVCKSVTMKIRPNIIQTAHFTAVMWKKMTQLGMWKLNFTVPGLLVAILIMQKDTGHDRRCIWIWVKEKKRKQQPRIPLLEKLVDHQYRCRMHAVQATVGTNLQMIQAGPPK